ncbi:MULTISPECIES: DUF3604 domain-containing protein [unclassified Chelatococcus]|uniref:DUF3604 domain-containing protein n=1 Tax=unclassified Chelatococcus TaxID=2638111 RepID=UPI001BCCC74D|nr:MULTISPECIES: DUF3604 domain-containing protein [unclassified Chelatococcus]CAH1671169.1 conserved hypothetical protein [Hyphomicrobiales bacterium]MBS7739111.1 DUF3604 domain-containing protein [Chelatococcus sp. HY11]MBX3543546.1 DUF3604 domain-containing protein [Chelatococcus sp.]MCO5076359.1 DUF3604 domain-containing protein [Chelatococcus sp.]CAH1676636.1 conserved hypothetical protein [Hyphomicrobiales bacterium]
MTTRFGPVDRDLIGEAVWETIPGSDPELYGSATLTGPSTVEVRSYQTFRVTYSVGKMGLDDTAAMRVAFRNISDGGYLQTTDPTAPNYVTARSSGDGRLHLKYDRRGGQRPWGETLTVSQQGGYLKPGETIEITIGETGGGSPGVLMPTFADMGRVFRIFVDAQATGVFVPIPGPLLSVRVIGGPAHRHLAVLPTLRRPGESFTLGIKAEDIWGNPTGQGPRRFRLSASLPVEGLPEVVDFAPAEGAITLEGLSCRDEGTLVVTLTDEAGGTVISGPLIIRRSEIAHYWGDLHAQTGETQGNNSMEYYLDFARNKAFLDVTSHQANDFQVNAAFWAHLNTLTAAADEPGRFTVLPGYEWSGNTAVGGDHNVFYRHEGASIYRCSHALVGDRSDEANDAHDLHALYAKLEAEPIEAVMYAHVGGRYADIHYAHNAALEAAVEVHSAWGTFEWILTDGFPLRHRVGVVCNSDDHKSRPGASFPGASVFGAYGGLTCFVMERNDRDSVFDAIRSRHTYGTSGPRVFIDVDCTLPEGGMRFDRDPLTLAGATATAVTSCTMGDIVRANGSHARVSVDIRSPVGIESVEIRDGSNVLVRRRTYSAADLGRRVRVLWSGAEYRGRGRDTRWRGRAEFEGAVIRRFEAINRLNPEMRLDQVGSRSVIWNCVTTGNMMGFDAWLSEAAGSLEITTSLGGISIDLSEAGVEPQVMAAGGLKRQLTVQRLPDAPLPKELRLEADVAIAEAGDTPVWLCVTFEDGNQAWTSPIYLHRD